MNARLIFINVLDLQHASIISVHMNVDVTKDTLVMDYQNVMTWTSVKQKLMNVLLKGSRFQRSQEVKRGEMKTN